MTCTLRHALTLRDVITLFLHVLFTSVKTDEPKRPIRPFGTRSIHSSQHFAIPMYIFSPFLSVSSTDILPLLKQLTTHSACLCQHAPCKVAFRCTPATTSHSDQLRHVGHVFVCLHFPLVFETHSTHSHPLFICPCLSSSARVSHHLLTTPSSRLFMTPPVFPSVSSARTSPFTTDHHRAPHPVPFLTFPLYPP